MHDLELHSFSQFENSENDILREERIKTFPSLTQPRSNDVSLVTQFTVNRFERFQGIVTNWAGPISAVVYLNNPWDVFTFWGYLAAHPRETIPNVIFTLVQPDYRVDFRHYPINKLRNIGIRAALTSQVFVIDADFRPTTGLYSYLSRYVVPEIVANPKHAYVVSGLAVKEDYRGQMPDSVSELRGLFNQGIAYITSMIGHSHTKYGVFLDQ
jgi:hypothetical protein